jgi:hypothetical protein
LPEWRFSAPVAVSSDHPYRIYRQIIEVLRRKN